MRLLRDPVLLSATIASIYDCVLRPAGWEAVLVGLADTIAARRAMLGVSDATGTQVALTATHNLASVEEVSRHTPYNPVMPFGYIWPPDRALVVSRDFGLPALKAGRFYREYLAPLGDLDAISFLLTREGSSFGHWILVTPESRGAITEEEAAGLELVAPHIRRAVEISGVLGHQRLSAATYEAALDRLDAAVLIQEDGGRVTYANPRATELLSAGSVLRLREGRLQDATPDAVAALRRLAAVEGTAAGAGGFEAIVVGTDGEERLLFAAYLDAERDDLPGRGGRSTLLVLRSPREETRNPVAIAARTFGLTPAQVQVLAFLAQGHAPDQIADILGVSMPTVRSHLAGLFQKTETARQAELVARTMSLASPLRGEQGPDGAGG